MWISRSSFDELMKIVRNQEGRLVNLEGLVSKKLDDRMDLLRESMDLENQKHKEMKEFFGEIKKFNKEHKNESSNSKSNG